MAGGANSLKSILYALGANFSIAIAKSIASIITGSSAMLAEAIHSFADTGNQLLLLLGLKQAKRPPTLEHPLGYGKAIFFWSFIVALMLFSMGGLFSVYEGVHKLEASEPLTMPWLAVGVLVFSVVAEGLSLFAAITEINKVRGTRSLWHWFRESRQSELIVIFGEDIAALVGLSLALVAVLLTIITGNLMFDALGSIAIGVVLLLVAIGVGIEVKALLIGQSAEPVVQQAIRDFVNAHDEVISVFNLITLQMGDRLMVSIKARMREDENAKLLLDDINRVEEAIRARFPQIQWLFFEPDSRY